MKPIIVFLVFCLVSCGGENANTRTSKNDSVFVTSGEGRLAMPDDIYLCLDSGRILTIGNFDFRFSETDAVIRVVNHVTGIYYLGDSNVNNYYFIKTGEHKDLTIKFKKASISDGVMLYDEDIMLSPDFKSDTGRINNIKWGGTGLNSTTIDSDYRSRIGRAFDRYSPFGIGISEELFLWEVANFGGTSGHFGGDGVIFRPMVRVPSLTNPKLYLDYNTRPIRLPRW